MALVLGRHHQAGVGRDRMKAGHFVEQCQIGVAHREAFQAGSGRALGLDHVVEARQTSLAFLSPSAPSRMPPSFMCTRPKVTPTRVMRWTATCREEGRGGQIDIGLGRLGHHLAILVQDSGAQHHQIDPAFVAVPFDRGLVIFEGDARQAPLDRAGQSSCKGPSETGPSSRRMPAPDHEKHHAATSAPTAQGGVADVMSLHIIGERQFQRGLSRDRKANHYRICWA